MNSIFNTVKNVFSQVSNNNNKNNDTSSKTNNVNHKTNNNINNLRGGYIRKNTLRKKRSSTSHLNFKTKSKGKSKRSKRTKTKTSKTSKTSVSYTSHGKRYCTGYSSYTRHKKIKSLSKCTSKCTSMGSSCNSIGLGSHCITYKNCKISPKKQNWKGNWRFWSKKK